MGRFVGLAGLAMVAVLAACDVAPDDAGEADEQDLTNGATRIASSLEGPGNLAVVGDNLVFSTAHFVASGDPDLDQQFAYWEGALYAKPLKSGAKKKIAKTAGAVIGTAVVGKDLLVIDSTYFGVSKFKIPTGTESDFYNDYAHFGDTGEEGPTVGGIAAGKSGVYVTRPGSEVMSMKTDGSDVKTFAKTWKSGWVELAEKVVVLDDAVFWSAQKEGDQGSTYNLYRATISGSTHTPKKLGSWKSPVRALATNGTDVFVAVEAYGDQKGEIDVAPGDGSKAPRALVVDVPHADNLVYLAGYGLFYSEWDHGVELVKDADIASGSAATPALVLKQKKITSIAFSKDNLFVADDPGGPNEKKGEILRYALAKIKH